MRHRSSRRRAGACAVAALLLVAAVAVAPPAAAAPTTRTVSTVSELTAELASPAASTEMIALGADLVEAPSTTAATQASSALTVDLAGHALALGSLALGSGSALRITDSTSSGGTLTVNGTAPNGGLVDTPVRVPNGTALTIDGTARVTATGGRSSAVIGARGAPDPYGGAGRIDVLGRAVVDVRGSSSGSGSTARTSSGIGGPLAAVHIGEHAVVHVVGTSAGAALGGGSGGIGGDSSVLIDGDAVVTASTVGSGGAAIGSAAGISADRLTTVVITDRAVVTAAGGPYAPGIGNGGLSSTRTVVTIDGSATVTATGGTSAAGIGGGVGSTSGGDGAAVTIGAGATVTAAGGSAADTAIGNGSGRAAASFGSLSNAGHLLVPAGAALRIPAGAAVLNSGTLTTAGPVSGAGTLANSGTVAAVGSGGSLDPATPVTGDRWAIAFDPGAAAPTGPTALRLTADSIGAGGTPAPMPAPPPGQVVVGWNTAADGSGQYVDDATDLRTVAPAPSGGGAVRLPLHAVLLPTADAVPRLPTQDPAAASSGDPSAGSFRVVSGVAPVRYRISAGALPAGLVLDAASGAVTGTAIGPQTARVTVEATNRFGVDTHEYTVEVAAPPITATPAPTATPQPVAAAAPTATAPAPTPTPSAQAPTPSPEPQTVETAPETEEAAPAPQTAETARPTSSPAATTASPQPVQGAPEPAAPLPQLPAALARTRLPIGASVAQPLGAPGTAVAVTAGELPAGLRIDRERALVRGTPTRPGRYRFTLSAMTAAGRVDRTYSLVVVAPLSVAVVRPAAARGLPLVAGSRTAVALRGLLPGERWVVRWAGSVVAHGTARTSTARLHLRVPHRAGDRVLTVRAADHAGASATVRTESVRAGGVLAVTAPAGVQANRVLTVRVGGLAPREPVRVRIEGRTVTPGDARADRHGRYRVDASAGWSWGWKAIEVHGLPGRTGTARVAVLPRRD